jgi:hypothetical protein
LLVDVHSCALVNVGMLMQRRSSAGGAGVPLSRTMNKSGAVGRDRASYPSLVTRTRKRRPRSAVSSIVTEATKKRPPPDEGTAIAEVDVANSGTSLAAFWDGKLKPLMVTVDDENGTVIVAGETDRTVGMGAHVVPVGLY